MFRKFFAPYGMKFSFVNMSEPAFFTDHQDEKNVSAIWVETPTNPTMKMVDIEKAAELAKKIGAMLIVDNTFCSPYYQNPLTLGADIVIHSATKYIGGHSDLVAGVIMTNSQELYDKIKFVQFAIGAMLNPFDCFLLHRSIKTLAVRMQRHGQSASKVAEMLAEHPKVETLFFPWLEKSPYYEIAQKQTRGPSGMMSFRLRGTMDDTTKFLQSLKVFTLAESLGGGESLVNHPEKMTHASVPAELRKTLGIDSQLVRLSVGVENVDDLVSDVQNALGD
jgi:cystathionine beta-lyase/cystathionine gamma-synthase